MGSESSGEYDVYMMVDGEPVKIQKDLPEISVGEHAEDLQENSLSELAEPWEGTLEIAGVDPEIIAEVFRKINEAMQALAKAFGALFGVFEESVEELEKRGVFDYEPTARKKKRERDRRQMIKLANASRFRQYKATKTAWVTQKRTGARRREWRGPWKER